MGEPDLTARHAGALFDLVELKHPVARLVAALAPFGWDSEDELVTFTRADATGVLQRYLHGTITDAETSAWAEAIEGRDDIGLEDHYEDLLRTFLFEIGTPEINEDLTPALAQHWLRRLTSS